MAEWIWILIALAVIAEVVAVLVFSIHMKSGMKGLFVGIKGMRELATELDRVVTEHMQANWSGQKEQLPQVLETLLRKARELATTKGIGLDEDMLRAAVVRTVAARKFASQRDAAAAMDLVPRGDAMRAA